MLRIQGNTIDQPHSCGGDGTMALKQWLSPITQCCSPERSNACFLTHQHYRPLHKQPQGVSFSIQWLWLPPCSLKRIHPRGKPVSKRLVCELKEVMHWQEQDDLCPAEIQHTGWQQPKLSSIWGGSSEQREGLWKSWDPEGWTPGFSMVLQLFRFPDPLSSEVICVCFPWHQPCSTCKVAKCCC